MPDMHIVVDPAGLEVAAKSFANHAETLAQLLSQVNRDMDDLAPHWQGAAAMQFAGLMGQWKSDFSNIQQVLEQVGGLIDKAQIGYSDLDTQIGRSFAY